MMIIALVLVSWALLLIEKKGLGALGFNHPRLRAREFGLGLLIAGAGAAIQQMGYSFASGVSWRLNPALTLSALGKNIAWTSNSVAVEELFFRGYLLYQAMRLLGPGRGVLLGAAAFGVYHWFSYGIVGQVVPMLYVFALTASFGGMCAYAFATTRSLAAPLGLHLGWNLITYVLFSAGPLGAALLLPADGSTRLKPPGTAGFLLSFVWPLAVVALIVFFLSRIARRRDSAQTSI